MSLLTQPSELKHKGNTEEVTLPALKKRLEAESRNNKIKESE